MQQRTSIVLNITSGLRLEELEEVEAICTRLALVVNSSVSNILCRHRTVLNNEAVLTEKVMPYHTKWPSHGCPVSQCTGSTLISVGEGGEIVQ